MLNSKFAHGISINIGSFIRLAALSALLFAFAGCTGIQYAEVDEELAQSSWQNMTNLTRKASSASGPYNASLSFRLRTPDEGFMLGAYVWSNGRLQSHHPLRLDLQSSVGSTVAKLKEEDDYFLLYDIKNNVAVISKDPQEALLTIGLPLPVSLGDLSILLNGRYTDFFTAGNNASPEIVATTVDQQTEFLIPDGLRKGILTVNSRGYPLKWESLDAKGWSMTIGYQDVAAIVANVTPLPGPSRVSLSHPDGYSIVINVKSLKKLPNPFTPAQLELRIPATADIREMGVD